MIYRKGAKVAKGRGGEEVENEGAAFSMALLKLKT
jgi:hypothetical protein